MMYLYIGACGIALVAIREACVCIVGCTDQSISEDNKCKHESRQD